MDVLDVVLIVAAALLAVRGLRVGFLAGAVALAAAVAAAIVVVAVAPRAVRRVVPTGTGERVVTVAAVVVAVVIAATVGRAVAQAGRRFHERLTGPGPRTVDALLGGTAAAVVFLVTAASLVPLANQAPTLGGSQASVVSAQVGGSGVVQAVRSALPWTTGDLLAPFAALLNLIEAPLFAPAATTAAQHLQVTPRPPAAAGKAPATTATATPPATGMPKPLGPAVTAAVRSDAASIVKIVGQATLCRQTQEGSGFVVAPHRVLTNAHVVAGVTSLSLQVGGRGRTYPATVVLYDPSVDVAILDVPGLTATPLHLTTAAQQAGTGAEAAGFPEDGPYTLSPALVASTVDAVGSVSGTQGSSSRTVYVITARIEPGNSGGPLLARDGSVIGVVFAKSAANSTTGFALTAAQVAFAVRAAPGLSRAVGTGVCSTAG